MKSNVRILVVEDSEFVREALRNLFANEPSIELVAEARDAEEAHTLLEQHRPDIALLDISLGDGADGFEVAQEIQHMKLPVKVMFVSGQDYSEPVLRDFVHRALAVGAAGFVLKSSSSADIVNGIKSVAAGQRHFSSGLTPYLLDLRDRAAAVARQYPGLAELKNQERRILILLADARTSREIAAELHLSHRTVENHLSVIREKLHLKGHHHLMKFAIEHKTELLLPISKLTR